MYGPRCGRDAELATSTTLCLFHLGTNLKELVSELEELIRFGRKTHNQHATDPVVAVMRATLDLVGDTPEPGSFIFEQTSEPEFLEDWYMLPLVEAAREAIGALQEGYKYCLVIPGILGGAYDVSNIKTAPLVEIVGLSGDIGRQIMALPDGATVKMKVVE